MVEQLQTIDAVHEAKRAFDMVFQSRDPFNEPLRESIVNRAILFHSNYLFNGCPEQYEAIAAAALSVGEHQAYASETEGHAQGISFVHTSAYHAVVDLCRTSLADLEKISRQQGYVGVTEAALYSLKGTWGAITSHDNHAVVGGPPAFMAVIADRIDLDAHVREFLAYQKRDYQRFGGDPSWVPRLLRHVYGGEIAAQYLKEAEFSVADPEPYQ